MPRSSRLLAVLVAGLLFAGCASVPTSGPVQQHSPLPAANATGVQVAPLPPAADATQLLVVEGFLHAMSVYQPGYPIARQYLTEQAARTWNPSAGVQVYADGYPPTETEQTAVLTAPLVGRISAAGVYEPTVGQLRIDFGLVKNSEGQWRISRPPEGLVVSRYLFSTAFTAVAVSFGSVAGDVLVPDPRYFPSGDDVARRAATAVLGGPSAWLAPAVRKATRPNLAVASVSSDAYGVTQVQLSGTEPSADERHALLAELARTLTSLADVTEIEVTGPVGLWSDADGRTQFGQSSFSQLDPDATGANLLFGIRDSRLVRQHDPSDWTGFTELAPRLSAVTGLAVNNQGNAWAAADAKSLQTGAIDAQRGKVLRSATALLRPAFSRSGELWSPGSGNLQQLRVYHNGAAVRLDTTGLPTAPVISAALSPDGCRLAVVLSTPTGRQVGLTRVVRNGDQITVDGWRPIDLASLGVTGATVLSVDWNSTTELAVLSSDDKQQSSVGLLSQDGAQLTDIGPTDSSSLTSLLAAPGRPVLARTSAGLLYRFVGEFDWSPIGLTVDAAAYSR